jgi:hypothetical protein
MLRAPEGTKAASLARSVPFGRKRCGPFAFGCDPRAVAAKTRPGVQMVFSEETASDYANSRLVGHRSSSLEIVHLMTFVIRD